MNDCIVCQGRGYISLPVFQPMQIEYRDDGLALPPLPRQYPCPECGGIAPLSKVRVAKARIETSAEVGMPEEIAEKEAAARLGHFIAQERAAITFTRYTDRSFYRTRELLEASIAIVDPSYTFAMEDRIKERQFEKANALVREACKRIVNWGSEYTKDNGTISKAQAVELITDALRDMKR